MNPFYLLVYDIFCKNNVLATLQRPLKWQPCWGGGGVRRRHGDVTMTSLWRMTQGCHFNISAFFS